MVKQSPRRSLFRLLVFCGFFLSVLIEVLLVPTIGSSSWGTQLLTRQLEKKIDGTIHIRSLSLSWFSGQKLEGLEIKGVDGSTILSLESVKTTASLLPLLFGKIPGQSEVQGLNVTLIPYTDGTTNIERLINKSMPRNEEKQLTAIKLENVEIHGGNSPFLNLFAQGKTVTDEKTGEFTFDISGIEDGKLKVNVNVTQFPVLVLDQLLTLKNPKLKGVLLTILGDTLNVKVSQVIDQQTYAFSLDKLLLDVFSDKSQISLSSMEESNKEIALQFKLGGVSSTPIYMNVDDKITLMKPAELNVLMTKEDMERLIGKEFPLNWSGSSLSKISFEEFQFPLDKLAAATMKAVVLIKNMIFLNDSYGDVKIIDGSLEVSGEIQNANLKLNALVSPQQDFYLNRFADQPLKLQLTGRLFTQNGAISLKDINIEILNNIFSFNMQGNLTEDYEFIMTSPAQFTWFNNSSSVTLAVDPFHISLHEPKLRKVKAYITHSIQPQDSLKIEFDNESQTIIAKGVLQDFPIGMISQELETFFGNSISGSLLIDIQNRSNGPVKIALNGDDGRITLDGRYDNGYLLLNKPLEGQFQITPRFSRQVLNKSIPFFSELQSAENPIAFKIEAENFSLPLFPFSLKQLNIGLASVDLGQLKFKNTGSLAKMLTSIISKRDPTISIWMTPIYLHLNNGILNVERTDFLIQKTLPNAAWGIIDLNNHWMDMQIGLSATTIDYAFNVQIGDPNGFIIVPLKGDLNKPVLDKAAATSQITSLVAVNQAGMPGAIFGTVLQIASGSSVTSNQNIPPRTTDPLPWEGQLQTERSDNYSNQRNNPLPIKSVTENAGKILKNLFR